MIKPEYPQTDESPQVVFWRLKPDDLLLIYVPVRTES